MDLKRKRKIRLIIALSCAVVLAGVLAFTSFNASSEAVVPSELARKATSGRQYQLTGKVEEGSVERSGTTTRFRVRDRDGVEAVPVKYSGTIPDPFREGREVIVNVRKDGNEFVGEKDSLITKCPSKFSAEKQS